MSIDQALAKERLAALVTLDSMVGTGLPKSSEENKAGAAG